MTISSSGKLVSSRETEDAMTIDRSQWSGLFSGVLSDILDELGVFGQASTQQFKHVDPGVRVIGLAATARAVPVSTPPSEPYAKLLGAIDGLSPMEVLVLSAPESSTSSLFGGLLATAVSQAGGAGALIDGYIRDADEVRRIGVPTAFRGSSPLDSFGRDEVVETGGPVSIGGVTVRPGDFVLCDADGLVVVPSEHLERVLELAAKKLTRESQMRAALNGGMGVATAFQEFGVL
ncbi:RraA family protein [Microbacterium sp. LWO12-1.2]|uniref:RraA family protein n=1 Tax=Microbacterium sp. LWO12-1.2 TaxID=3135261 RepID=UPI003445544A